MLSVEMPLMDRMMSPTFILALAALPPSVSCNDTKNNLKTSSTKSIHKAFSYANSALVEKDYLSTFLLKVTFMNKKMC